MDKVALITGVLGGIGYATARIFKAMDWTVVGVDRNNGDDRDGLIDLFIQEDIAKLTNVDRLFKKVCEHYNGLDALVNNAAIQVVKSVIDTTEEEWDEVFNANVKSVFRSIKYAHPLLARRKGAIVNVSSVHAFATSINISSYAASKGALLAFTRSLSLEFAHEGIRVNAVIPGAVKTNMLLSGLSRGHLGDDDMRTMIDKLGLRHPINRIGNPEEIGKLIYFLSDNSQSSFITGQSFVADGGALAQLSTETK